MLIVGQMKLMTIASRIPMFVDEDEEGKGGLKLCVSGSCKLQVACSGHFGAQKERDSSIEERINSIPIHIILTGSASSAINKTQPSSTKQSTSPKASPDPQSSSPQTRDTTAPHR